MSKWKRCSDETRARRFRKSKAEKSDTGSKHEFGNTPQKLIHVQYGLEIKLRNLLNERCISFFQVVNILSEQWDVAKEEKRVQYSRT